MRSRHTRTALSAAALLLTVVIAGCSPGADESDTDATDDRAATATSERSPASSSSKSSSSAPSTSPSRSLLPPVVPIVPPTTTSASPSAPTGPLIASATWAESDYGATLKIAPTDAGRTADGATAARTAWEEVLALAPEADTPGMWEQFDCHWVWARILEPDKPTWNVEPWRPVVDEGQMVAEACNPGGPEV